MEPHQALLFRVYCEHVKKEESDDELEAILPQSLNQFLLLLQSSVEDEFVTKQLLLVIQILDLSDETRRRSFESTVSKMIPDPAISEPLRRILMTTLRHCTPDESDFVRIGVETISEIQDPMEEEHQQQQKEASDDKKLWLRCATVCQELLRETKHVIFFQFLINLFTDFHFHFHFFYFLFIYLQFIIEFE